MKRTTKTFDFTITKISTKDASGDCQIEGYANTSSKDRVGDVVLPSAFEKSLPTYLKNPVMLLNHDWNDVVGVCTSAEITDKGLFIKGKISNTREDIKTLIREGCYRTFSIGYNEVDADYEEATKTKYIKELELLEISVVSVPANTEAMFTRIEAKTETESSEKTNDEKKSAKTAKDLKAFISTIKSVVTKDLDEKSLFAVIDYFNTNEEVMTKEQLIEVLKVKTLTQEEPKKEEVKQEAPTQDQQPSDDLLKQIAAKLDQLAQAMVQVMEKLEKPAQEEPKEEAKQDEEPKMEDESAEDEQKAKEEDCDKDEEMSEEEVEKQLADLTSQISDLDETVNG